MWVPSQKPWLAVCLQLHMYDVLVSSATNTFGENSVPLCDPSQNGCFDDFPQAHQAYVFPASNWTGIGVLPAIVGFFIKDYFFSLSKSSRI